MSICRKGQSVMGEKKNVFPQLTFGQKAMLDKDIIEGYLNDLMAVVKNHDVIVSCQVAPSYAKEQILKIYDEYIINSLELMAAVRALKYLLEEKSAGYTFYEYMEALKKTAKPYEYIAEYEKQNAGTDAEISIIRQDYDKNQECVG